MKMEIFSLPLSGLGLGFNNHTHSPYCLGYGPALSLDFLLLILNPLSLLRAQNSYLSPAALLLPQSGHRQSTKNRKEMEMGPSSDIASRRDEWLSA